MSNIQPYTPQSLLPALPTAGGRLARQTSRQIAAIGQAVEVRTAAVAAAAEVQQAKAAATAQVGGYAMSQAAQLSAMQTQLALAVPNASGDLDYIKTLAVLALGQVVVDTARQVGR